MIIALHWKPDIKSPFVQEKNGLICGLFLYTIHTLDNLHDLDLGESILISGFFLYPAFLYPVSSVYDSFWNPQMDLYVLENPRIIRQTVNMTLLPTPKGVILSGRLCVMILIYLVVQPFLVVALELVRQLHLLPQHGAQTVVDRVAFELGKLQNMLKGLELGI